MRALVTGVAGFIGSHLAERLLAEDHEVVGVDGFTDAYDPAVKRANLQEVKAAGDLDFREADLRTADLPGLLYGVDVVFHLAAVPGVRASWADGFDAYVEHNVLATQRLLEAAKTVEVPRVVYASSSSVYGNAARYPVTEEDLPRPHSPYGVSKLAAEHLCTTYSEVYGVHTVALRYFSVYGPRQRPDMGVHRMVEAALSGSTFRVYGDGSQVRDMTFVGDVVAATVLAGVEDVPPGTVLNVAGGTEVTVIDLLDEIGRLTGGQVPTEHTEAQPGDVRRTGGATERARQRLGWAPAVPLREGLSQQVRWHESYRTGSR